MDINAYINSGVLELYLLNQLTEQEGIEVEEMCKKYPEILAERIAIEEALESLAGSEQKRPPAFLKDVILNEINNHSRVSDVTGPRSMTSSSSTFYWAVAASVIGVITTLATFFFYSQTKDLKNQLSLLEQQTEISKNELAVFKNPDFKQINLAKVDSTKEIQTANIYWNKTSSEVFISWNNKDPLPSDKQYQLWAIVDGKPVDAGVFDISDSLQQMKRIANATAFAVTIEQKGGSATPTLSSMVVMGAI